jgi:DNA-directed RNA polymerase subunit RPC12/RpoP
MGTKYRNHVFYVWLVDLQTIALNTGWKYDSLQMMIFVCLFAIQRSWFKTRFESWITWNDVNNVNLFLFSYLITLMLYLCSHCAPPVQIVYSIFDWSIYILFLLSRGWKLEPLQMIIFVYFCSTCSVGELKTSFETWITRNGLNGVNLFHLAYLITLTTYLYSQLAPNVQIKYFMFDCSIYILFVLNRWWKRDSLQMMIFVYICSTCSVVELKTSFWFEIN